MSMILEAFTTLYPDQIWLEVSPDEIEKKWPSEQEYSYDVARWNAFLNRLTLDVFLRWIEEESGIEEQPEVWPSLEDLPSIWEVVNGTAIKLGGTRIVLIPSGETDTNEFCVPAEWADIPSWAADYYLAVQVNPDDCWLRVWGYTTHKKLKQVGQYDNVRRTYSLEREELIEDLNVMWVARELGGDRKAAVDPLPTLLPAQAENLLEQLSQPSSYSPRLKVDFAQWGAWIENETRRQQLYERRLGRSLESVVTGKELVKSGLVKLGQWFQRIFEPDWQPVELVMTASHRGGTPSITSDSAPSEVISRAREIKLNGQQIAVIVTVKKETNDDIGVYLRVRRAGQPTYLSRGLQLMVLDESGDICAQTQAGYEVNWLDLGYDGQPGKQFSVKVALKGISVTERFVF